MGITAYPVLCQKLGLNLIGKLGTLLATPGEKVIPPDGAEFRLEVVKLHLEDGYSIAMLADEFGCGKSTIQKWARAFREQAFYLLDSIIFHELN